MTWHDISVPKKSNQVNFDLNFQDYEVIRIPFNCLLTEIDFNQNNFWEECDFQADVL